MSGVVLADLESAVLRQPAAPVAPAEFGSPGFLRQVAALHKAFDRFFDQRSGVGLAAPQIGWSRRVLVAEDFEPGPNSPAWASDVGRLAGKKGFDRLLMCNPELVAATGRHVCWESCLSEPEVAGMVARSACVRIRYLDEHGAWRELEANGWKARILQHEIDHLNGRLCSSLYLPGTRLSQQEYSARWRNRSLKDALAALSIDEP